MSARGITSRRGLSLLEIIVALAIAGAILLMVLGAVRGLMGNPSHTEVMQFVSSIRYAYGEAAVRSHRYDVIMDLDAGSYSLACTDQNTPVIRELPNASASQRAFGRNRATTDAFDPNQNQERGLRRTRDGTSNDPRSIELEESPDHISGCESAMVQATNFERGVRFVSVQTSRSPDIIESGQARLAIFPDGTMERAIIVLQTERGRVYTLLTDEMTGRIELLDGEPTNLDDFFRIEEAR